MIYLYRVEKKISKAHRVPISIVDHRKSIQGKGMTVPYNYTKEDIIHVKKYLYDTYLPEVRYLCEAVEYMYNQKMKPHARKKVVPRYILGKRRVSRERGVTLSEEYTKENIIQLKKDMDEVVLPTAQCLCEDVEYIYNEKVKES